MPLIQYITKRLQRKTRERVAQANEIIHEYMAAGYDLTLRQLYYQFVARDLIPNTMEEYDRLGRMVSDARLLGLIDWNAITDRTRNPHRNSFWRSPNSLLDGAVGGFRIDRWADQDVRVEVWVEKEALAGVLDRACPPLMVDYFSCRGYVSQSAMWEAAQRFLRYRQQGKDVVIFHLGDHDPSGIDMSRDIQDRLNMFCVGDGPRVERIALNMDQIRQYNPPPNPAKVTDSRYEAYREQYGEESWELDALSPTQLAQIITDAVNAEMDADRMQESIRREQGFQDEMAMVASNWRECVKWLQEKDSE